MACASLDRRRRNISAYFRRLKPARCRRRDTFRVFVFVDNSIAPLRHDMRNKHERRCRAVRGRSLAGAGVRRLRHTHCACNMCVPEVTGTLFRVAQHTVQHSRDTVRAVRSSRDRPNRTAFVQPHKCAQFAAAISIVNQDYRARRTSRHRRVCTIILHR